MDWEKDIKIILCSGVLGVFIICYLVGVGILERISIVVITLNIYYLIKKHKETIVRFLLCILAGLIVGISVSAYVFFHLNIEQGIINEINDKDDTSDTAVLLILRGEPERYDPYALLQNLKTSSQISDYFFIPFRLYKLKRAYESVGISRYNELGNKIALKLSQQLDYGYDVFISYVNNQPYYQDVMNNNIIKRNYRKLIVAPICLTKSVIYTEVIKKLELQNLYHTNIQLKFMQPLWNAEKIPRVIVQEVNRINKNTSKNEVGIILLAEELTNYPQEILDPKTISQKQLFIEKIRMLLMNSGYEERKIKSNGIMSNERDLQSIVSELMQYGVVKIFVININDVWSLIEEQHKMYKILNKIKHKEELQFYYLKGWGNHHWVLEELEYRIRLLNVYQ